jgi:hypothetical protein
MEMLQTERSQQKDSGIYNPQRDTDGSEGFG